MRKAAGCGIRRDLNNLHATCGADLRELKRPVSLCFLGIFSYFVVGAFLRSQWRFVLAGSCPQQCSSNPCSAPVVSRIFWWLRPSRLGAWASFWPRSRVTSVATCFPWGTPLLVFVPQGLVMGLYSLAAALLATYLWYVIAVNVGGGSNRFDKDAGVVTISRRGFRKPVLVEIPLKDVKAVKVEVRDGFNARRRVALRIQGRRDMPLTRVGEPLPLAQLEKDGAELARFLGVNLEGL